MNLQKLFEMQAKLDKKIIEEKGLEGQDLLPKKILALQVELGELANEWRGFKFWSHDQEPIIEKRTYKTCPSCTGEYVDSCWMCGNSGQVVDKIINPLLEEYVDCLHFILSIGLEITQQDSIDIEIEKWKSCGMAESETIVGQFLSVMYMTNEVYYGEEEISSYELLFAKFICLGEMLDFTWEQIEEVYIEKINNCAKTLEGTE